MARLVGDDAARILDVGGVPDRLAPFLPEAAVVCANVEPPADVVFDGDRLPFADGEFDVAVSIDVLEHMSASRRVCHVAELRRVAARRVVLCCPLGTPEHAAAEQDLADWYAELGGRREPFLDEHAEHGLPSEDDLRELLPDAQLSFHGDFRRPQRLFRRRALAHFRRRPTDRAAYLWSRLVARPGRLTPQARSHSNRVFAVVSNDG